MRDYVGKKIVDIMMVESDDFPNNNDIDRIYFVFEDDSVLLLMRSEGQYKDVGLDVFTISRHGASYSKREDRYFTDQRVLTPFIGVTLTCTWDIFTQHYAMWMYGMSFNDVSGALPLMTPYPLKKIVRFRETYRAAISTTALV